jgi:hypothetical protein
MFVEAESRRRLGLARDAASVTVMEALLLTAGTPTPAFSLPNPCLDWFVVMANELAGFAGSSFSGSVTPQSEMVTELVGKARTWMAPVLLATIAPSTLVAQGPARELPAKCKTEVAAHLPPFCNRIIGRWREDEFRPPEDQ